MAWAFVGVSNVVEVTATSHALVTTGIAGTLQAGDLLVACISSRIASTTSVTLPVGWTLVSEQKNNNILTTGSAAPSGLMAYCVRGASNPALTFTHPVAPSVAIGRIVAYRDVSSAAPKDTQTSFTTATGITAVSGAGLTTTEANDLIVALAAGGQEAAWSAFNATSPSVASGTGSSTIAPITSWLERADSLTTTGVDTSLAIFDAVKVVAGATGNLTATASVAAAHVVVAGAFRIFVAPATGTGTLVAQNAIASGVGTIIDQSTADAWSLADKSAAVTLSNSDKTAILSSSVTSGVRSTQHRTSGAVGKFYVEFIINAANPFGVQVGFSSTAQSVTATTDAIRVDAEIGDIFFGATKIGDAWDGNTVNGDVICLAWDTSEKDGWVRLNSGEWNNNSSNDPATGVGGFNVAAVPDAVDYALWMRAANSGRGATLRTEATELTYSGPSGFTSWMGEALPTPSITGTGALVAESAAVAGAGEAVVSDITGTGALAAQSSDADGAGTISGAPDAWNSADKSANITLSNNDKTATLSAAVTSGVRSTTKYLNGTETQKFYVEFLLNNVVGTVSNQVGLREVSASLTSTAGSTAQCASNSGNILTGNATIIGNIGGSPLVDGDVICMAWTPATERIWFRKNSGLWNNDAAANPATNTNGLNISVLNNTDHALFFLIASTGSAASTTVRTEAADLTCSAPSGFVSWMGEALSTPEATGTGALASQSSAVAGAGLSASTGDGAANAQTATVAGTGAVASSGTGALPSDVAIVAGAGVSASTGTGSVVAESAAVAGTGSAAAANSGALVAESATVAAAGVASSDGVGALAADATTIAGSGQSVSTGSGELACGAATIAGVGVVLEEGVAVGTGELLAGAASISGEGEVTGEVAVPPVYGGYHYRPDRRPLPVEGHGYGILQIEGEAHGVVIAAGNSIGTLPRFAGQADAAAGAAGSSTAHLALNAAALGNAVNRGRGFGMIVKFEAAAVGRHDDDEAAIVAWLLAA